jgi:glycolate oxidase
MILFDVREPGILERVMAAGQEILVSCIEAGGTITGEHGVGMEKMAVMPLIFSRADLDVMARVRSAVEPSGHFNPGKMLPSGASLHGAPDHKVMQPLVAEGMWV